MSKKKCATWADHKWKRVWPLSDRTKTRGAPMFTCTECGEPGWEI